jgi:exosortase A
MEAAADRTWHHERSVGWVVGILGLVLTIFWQTTWSMVELWGSSGTYSHGFLVLPAFVWLVWRRRLTLSRLPMRSSWLGVLALAVSGLIWLIGRFAAANAPTQLALVAMVPAAIAAVLGAAWLRALAFPLAFLLFAVPIGDSLVPYLTDWTADFTVMALRLSGVPVHREGNFFSIPSGNWSVLEACSGMRYVFGGLMAVTLYAWTVYRSNSRRLLFVTGALAITVVANWFRAYGIVMLAHLSNNRLATDVDHFIYGGLFFVVIMTILFALGALWREDLPDSSAIRASSPTTSRDADEASQIRKPRRTLAAALATAVTLSVWPLISLATGAESRLDGDKMADIEPQAGWIRVDQAPAKWRPHLSNPSQVSLQTFIRDGRRVGISVGVFGRPAPDSKLTSSLNRLVASNDLSWNLVQHGVAEVHHHGQVIPIETATLIGREAQIVAWHWYWVDGLVTTSPSRAMLAQVLARLRGRSEVSAWVTVYTVESEGIRSAGLVLEDFLSDMLDSINLGLLKTANRAPAL